MELDEILEYDTSPAQLIRRTQSRHWTAPHTSFPCFPFTPHFRKKTRCLAAAGHSVHIQLFRILRYRLGSLTASPGNNHASPAGDEPAGINASCRSVTCFSRSIYVVPETQLRVTVLLTLYITGEAVNEGHDGFYVIQSIAPLLSQICIQ